MIGRDKKEMLMFYWDSLFYGNDQKKTIFLDLGLVSNISQTPDFWWNSLQLKNKQI